MPDVDTSARREKRVVGVFLLMLGAGLILDLGSLWPEALPLLCGAGLIAWGTARRRVQSPASTAVPVSSTSEGRP